MALLFIGAVGIAGALPAMAADPAAGLSLFKAIESLARELVSEAARCGRCTP
ncbi:hypothetical protein ACFY9N_17020 [Microbacterium sp. NPDC008134]|uniref:hypothetical protein n=1 Tax=Microbacterium sp. NPDC008134 TaxID=3364183 RepID=UPI0036EBC6EC